MDQPPPNSLSKSWSCAVDSNNISNKNNFHHRPSALSAVSSRLPSFDGFQLSPIEDFNFDPNDRQYLFCCGKGHSTVGVKVIAGMLCLSVLSELWLITQQILTFHSHPNNSLFDSLFQLLFGAVLATSMVLAIWLENCTLLLPYLLMQSVGLCALFLNYFLGFNLYCGVGQGFGNN
uniref:Uncharacterized protein n=1 Tax=Meloidogyne enterolobii TaxID=390850 RepID=A0A6V7UDD4_MELEN|nr:unnamed protein product [Meloidogyne enterolobii]